MTSSREERGKNWLTLINPGETIREFALRIGRNFNTIRGDIAAAGGVKTIEEDTDYHHVGFDDRQTTAEVYSKSYRITSLDDLIQACQIDLGIWEVERHIINKWETGRDQVTLVQVKAWLRRRVEADLYEALEEQITQIKTHAPRYNQPVPLAADGEYLFVPSLYDIHFGSRAVDSRHSLQTAARDYKAAVDALMSRALALNMPIKRVLFVPGNDALHTDNLTSTTSNGTAVETAVDIRDAISILIDCLVYAVERFALIAPVDVVPVESNHDRLNSYWMGKILEAYFINHPGVSVDIDRNPRKYYRFGQTLIGLEHGDKIKPDRLALIMATEAKADWARTTFREWLTGHWHRKQNMYFQATEEMGVVVRRLPALCPTDQYHLLLGFVGNHRAAEGLFYHYDFGPAGMFPVFIDELADKREEKELAA